MIKFLKKEGGIITLLLLFSIPASLPLILPGFYEPHDLHHFADIYQMARTISLGQLPPRLGPDFTFGYGYPLFNFYYLMPFYLGALFFFLLGSVIASFKLVFLTTVVLSIFGMYLFLREFVGKWASIVGSILFLYTPYRAVQIYVRGAMGEAFALSLLPFVAWGLVRVVKKPKNERAIPVAALIAAVFILSHNYLWALSSPLLLILVLFLADKKKIKDTVQSVILVGLLALGIAAYWWLPALIEQRLVVSKTPFPLIDHFPFIKQLIIPSWGYGSSVWGPGDEISFQIGLVNLSVLLALVSLNTYRKKLFNEKFKSITLWALMGFVISLILMNVRTYPLWKLVPFHDYIQFPWRLLIFTTFFTSVMAAVLVEVLSDRRKRWISLLIIGASIFLTVSYFRPSKVFYKTDNDYLSRFFANRTLTGTKDVVSRGYLQYSEDYLLLPDWVDRRPENLPLAKIESEDAQIGEVENDGPFYWKAKVKTARLAKVTFNVYYFPGWFARVDGDFIETKPGKPYGQIEIVVPKGEHTLELFWKETTLRKTADFISLASLGIVIGLLTRRHISGRAAKEIGSF